MHGVICCATLGRGGPTTPHCSRQLRKEVPCFPNGTPPHRRHHAATHECGHDHPPGKQRRCRSSDLSCLPLAKLAG
jgi:hypothetical protein